MQFAPRFNTPLLFLALAVPSVIIAVPTGIFGVWRQFVPLPPVPKRTPVYEVRDLGVTHGDPRIYSVFPELVLRPDGTVRDARDSDYETFFALKERFPARTAHSASVRGYEHWGFYSHNQLSGVNRSGTLCGTGRLDTDAPSCTHPYYGHGRTFGVVWRKGLAQADDLNALISAQNGWYIVVAFCVTDRGQILCLACRTDAKGAEHRYRLPQHLVVLTPVGTDAVR